MGGDLGPRSVVPACLTVLAKHPAINLILVGDAELLQQQVASANLSPSLEQRLQIQPASQLVLMEDSPARMLREKTDSSMRVALQLVSDGKAHACVSAGNTGALMALAKHIIKPLEHIERPAIMTALPCVGGHTYLLDLGANVDASASQLVQFALMGSAAVKLTGVQQPRVALLNVGSESLKGCQTVRQAAASLEQLAEAKVLNYIGYIEGDAVFKGQADVVVCDGFVGNVLLKGSEGLARFMAQQLQQQVLATSWRRFLAWLGRGMWQEVKQRWSPDNYNGALLLGVDGVVVKSHGAANETAFAAALEVALQASREDLPQRLAKQLATESS